MAHQYIEQLTEKVKPAVFGNVGTMVVFRVGAADAEELVKEFTPTFTEEDLVNLPKYEMYLKLMIDGIASSPFSAAGLPPLRDDEQTGNTQKVIEYSRQKYASDRASVEEKIMSWHDNDGGEPEGAAGKKNIILNDRVPHGDFSSAKANILKASAVSSPPKNVGAASQKSSPPVSTAPQIKRTTPAVFSQPVKTDSKSGYPAICSNCGKETATVFKPDGIRPVYCRECLSKKKEEKRLEVEARREAKEQEKEKFALDSQEPAAASSPSLSLNDIPNLAPRDFRGREIKSRPASSSLKTERPDHHYEEKDLQEGEEVIITNNSF